MNDFLKLIQLITIEAEKLKREDGNKFYTTNNIHNAIIKFTPKIARLEEKKYDCYRQKLISAIKSNLNIEDIIKNILVNTYKNC